MPDFKCSECGKEVSLYRVANYSYRVPVTSKTKSQLPLDSIIGQNSYQCSYTCNDHAQLRLQHRQGHMTYENIIRYIEKSEESIRHKGREVRYPIDISKIKKR